MDSHWSWPKKIGFLFLSYYIFLYAFSTQFITSAVFVPIWKKVVPWFAKLVGHPEEITIFPAGSGDTTYNYYEILWFAVFALLLAIITAVLDRKRGNYLGLIKWVSLLLRYYLAAQMINYGLAKLYYMQFSFPGAARFDQKLGDFSPMGLLWTFMGYSKGYTMFTGAMEFVGGILLLSRYTSTLGALTTFGVMVNVMMLNFCYDVPVKLLSSHLVLFSIFLIGLDADRLLSFFITNRPVKPRMLASIANEKQQKIASIFKWVIVIGYLAFQFYNMNKMSYVYGPKAEKVAFHGKYNIVDFQHYRDGGLLQDMPPSTEWKSIYRRWSGRALIVTSDDKRNNFHFEVDTSSAILKLRLQSDTDTLFQELTYKPVTGTTFEVSGIYYGDSLNFLLQRSDLNEHLLVNRGFHWINEYPFNR